MKEKKTTKAPPNSKSAPPPKAKAKALIQPKLLEKTTKTLAKKKEKKAMNAPPKAKSTPRPKAKAKALIKPKMKLKIASQKISSAPLATAKASIGQ
jgi:hypothetical protein